MKLGLGLGVASILRGNVTPSITPPNFIDGPTITGVGYVGYTLTVISQVSGTQPIDIEHQWQRWNGTTWDDIGADQDTYEVTLADEGVPIRCVVTATNSEGSADANSNAIEQWVPTDSGATVENWWDAWDSDTITIATGVSQWANKGTLGGSLASSLGAEQPVYSATAFQGAYPGVTFDGSNDKMVDNTANNSMRNTDEVLIALALDNHKVSGTQFIVGSTSGTSSTGSRTGYRFSGSTAQPGGRRRDTDSFQIVNGSTVGTGPKVVLAFFDYGSASAYDSLNGVDTAPQSFHSAGLTSNTASLRRRLGSNPSGTAEFYDGVISEVLTFSQTISAANRKKLGGYLAWRWRTVAELDAGSPYKTEAPTP